MQVTERTTVPTLQHPSLRIWNFTKSKKFLTFITFMASKDSLSLGPRFPSGGLSPGMEVGSRLISVFITVMWSLTWLYSCCIRPVLEKRSTNRSAKICNLQTSKQTRHKPEVYLYHSSPLMMWPELIGGRGHP